MNLIIRPCQFLYGTESQESPKGNSTVRSRVKSFQDAWMHPHYTLIILLFKLNLPCFIMQEYWCGLWTFHVEKCKWELRATEKQCVDGSGRDERRQLGRELHQLSDVIAWCAVCFSHVCHLEDKPWEAGGLLGKKKEGLLCTMRRGNCVCFSVCVRGWQRYSPQQRDQRAYEKTHKCLASEWLRWRERLSNPRLGAEICPAKSAILNSHLGFGDRFPLTAAGCCDGGSICHLQILEETMLRGALGAIWDSELRVFAV